MLTGGSHGHLSKGHRIYMQDWSDRQLEHLNVTPIDVIALVLGALLGVPVALCLRKVRHDILIKRSTLFHPCCIALCLNTGDLLEMAENKKLSRSASMRWKAAFSRVRCRPL